MKNTELYDFFSKTPAEARKTIGAGKLKGMTDINPMWRIKILTARFGPQGIGFKFSIVDTKVIEADGESMVHCTVSLQYRTENGEWSEPVYGVGGSKLCGKGVGDGINDEAFKMAYTDAISICCKGLGMSADIYFEKDRTKYSLAEDEQNRTASQVKKPEPTTARKQEEDTPTAETAYEEKVAAEFAACKTIAELKELYNETYGGNENAPSSIKKIANSRLKEIREEMMK